MSHKLKYKVISFTSQEQEFPISSLLVPGSQGWNSKRFCNFPQEVTLQFYGITHINKIQLISDSRKIASSIDILYYNPSEAGTESRFSKYGSLQFSRNQNGRMRQQKTLMVDLKCLYLRFLLYKPYKSKENFFSQVGLYQVIISGGQTNLMLPLEPLNKHQNMNDEKQMNDEEDEFVYQKLLQLNSEKQRAISEEDFDEADRLKQVMVQIKKYGYILKGLKDNKQRAIETEDFNEAKKIKDQIDNNKLQIEQLLNGDMEYEKNTHKQNQMNFEDDIQDNEFVDPEMNKLLDRHNLQQSRISHKGSILKNSSGRLKKRYNVEQSYDERVVPALMNKVKTEQSQEANFEQKQEQVDLDPEQIDGKYASDALLMQDFFEEKTIKQLFSKHWKLKMKGLTTIEKQIGKKKGDASLIKCLLVVVKNSLYETNFQLSQISLNLLQQTLKLNSSTHKISKPSELANDLQKIITEVVKRLSDNNHKLKSTAEEVFQEMLVSSLYGIQACCSVLMNSKLKSKTKLSSKQQVQRLHELSKIVSRYGLGSNNAPYSVIDYAIHKLDNPSSEVRNEAINLLAGCSNVDKQRVEGKLQGKKGVYLQQIELRQKQNGQNGKGNKKK